MGLRWGTAIVAVLSLCGASACGRFARSSPSSDTTSTARSSYETLPPLTGTSTTGPGVFHQPTVAPPTTAKDRCAPPNRTVRDDPSGFRLVLVVAPRQCVSRGDDLQLELDIENISKQPLQYDTNQTQFFSINPEGDVSRPGWDDS